MSTPETEDEDVQTEQTEHGTDFLPTYE